MLQRYHHILRRLNNLLDAGVTASSFGLAYLSRNHAVPLFWKDLGLLLPFEHYAPLMVIACFLWPIGLNYHGLYAPTRLRKAAVDVGIIFRTSAESTILLFAIVTLFQMETTSRLFLTGFGLFNALILVTKDLLRRQYSLSRRLKGSDLRSVLVVGTLETAAPLIRKLREESYLGLEPLAIVLPREGGPTPREVGGVPVVGTLEKWREILHAHPPAAVLFTNYREYTNEVEKALWVCHEEGVESWLLPNFFVWNLPQVDVDHFANIPILVFRTTPILSWPYVFKVLFDRLFSLFFLVVLSPLLVLIALGIRITSGGPALYRQPRVGRFGRLFPLYKFRTFVPDGSAPTGIGRWLRRTGLDELPQLINIVKGEMSFVGPRPHVPEEVKQYSRPWQRRRLSMRPGLTCYRQILGPQKIPFDEAIDLDLKYIDKWSFGVDLFLIFKTIALSVKRLFPARLGG